MMLHLEETGPQNESLTRRERNEDATSRIDRLREDVMSGSERTEDVTSRRVCYLTWTTRKLTKKLIDLILSEFLSNIEWLVNNRCLDAQVV